MKDLETKIVRAFVVKAEPDDDLIDAILTSVRKYEIKAGLFNVIGAFKKVTLGYFDLETKEYDFNTLDEDVELISCIGNIAHKNDTREPIVHAHVVLGRRDYSTIGGHLGQPSIISVTGEIFIYEIEEPLTRAHEEQFDLSLLNL